MHFVVAVDGSEAADRALDYALTMAEPQGAAVTIVHSVEPRVLVEGGEEPVVGVAGTGDRIVAESLEDAETRAGSVLEEAEAHATEAGVETTTELLYGDPVEALPSYVDDVDADGIFVGHRGLSKQYEGLVGSVAKELVERSPCPVTVVR
ncbi:universal stress protein [Haloferax mediterranei ATCC 33500]|uniref:Stress response protein n=1 Tax=Haloferax mediterranei (strain ATCC 33500 / DSM 1411 / JCM 8866 / NBRC 14739 / NCIMB 2177 / R-4) TaxID=523841 RepID=I3R1M0_HALMT|nr:universal stress protein [Haloferax mediterranei]AFK18130.1 stress response protein [Haloferax mediterranei ATCC 33500]AHZ22463.1 universal stress protein UspA [Haloferax mediterranei ATCC 33500]EMA02597.1 stress response protein [Haloferax mediterranei ATCC 33500]MDX5988220.1 universal stress protein [Haloferax mediterranei ATCC 33500]QCQ74662.1 universal stress protein [Haloferax mediterranei ATCC 33500]